MNVTYIEAGQPKQVHCKVLVGADGYFSTVRQQCLGDGPPDFAVRLGQQPCVHLVSSQAVPRKCCIAALSAPLPGCINAEHGKTAIMCAESAVLWLFAGHSLLESAPEG